MKFRPRRRLDVSVITRPSGIRVWRLQDATFDLAEILPVSVAGNMTRPVLVSERDYPESVIPGPDPRLLECRISVLSSCGHARGCCAGVDWYPKIRTTVRTNLLIRSQSRLCLALPLRCAASLRLAEMR